MKDTIPSQRHFHFLSDISPELPLLALGGAAMCITTLAVYLYAATI